ncbi:MAG: hypothetical protein M1823_000383 [Watsoniomyces obsoletus]|nr:MAG: hypothetical protein M1823_000383 [Watsoniomyces obsoletus]
MPPRSSLTSSFAVSDAANEVVCPLRNADGSSCRKRCLGEKRYRSMQEHIRRAHPAYYISKLPATEESFSLMINTPPSDRPRESTGSGIAPVAYGHERNATLEESSSPATPRNADDYPGSGGVPGTSSGAGTSLLPAASAAAALAQLHQNKLESEWDSEPVGVDGPSHERDEIRTVDVLMDDGAWSQETVSETEAHFHPKPSSSIELPGMAQMKQAGFFMSPFDPGRPRQLLPSILSKTLPGGRSSTLPPIQRRERSSRPRKSSITQHARKPQHEKKRSRGEHVRRMSYEGRKAFSAEPSGPPPAVGNRWEDLIDAAASATEDVDGDRTPIVKLIRDHDAIKIPHSSPQANRASLPPFSTAFPQSYQASPLQNALTPPSYAPEPPLPSVESVETYHPESRSVEDSSPSSASQNVQIYCAACQNSTMLRTAFACTECICGICRECVDILVAEHGARRSCPRCGTVGGRYRPFQLDIR